MYLHGGDEMKSLFTKEQIDELRLNPYTYHVSNTTIKFTEEFKDAFRRLYLQDMPLRDIVRTLGYDYDVLGEKRVGGFIYNLRKNRLTPEQRVASSSPQRITRPPANTDYTHMYAGEAIKNMSAELTYLRQEVEFLKKLSQLEIKKDSED